MISLASLKEQPRIVISYLNLISNLALYTNNRLMKIIVNGLQDNGWLKITILTENLTHGKIYEWRYTFRNEAEGEKFIGLIRTNGDFTDFEIERR